MIYAKIKIVNNVIELIILMLKPLFFPRKKSVISFIFRDQNYILNIHGCVNSGPPKIGSILQTIKSAVGRVKIEHTQMLNHKQV